MLLFEFATGVHPFPRRRRHSVCGHACSKASPLPARPAAGLAGAGAARHRRCLQRRASDRFQHASDIIVALDGPAALEVVAPDGFWWRVHMSVILAMYVVAALSAWSIHELVGTVGRSGFAAVTMLGTIGGIFRGHLLFTERQLDRRPFSRASPLSDATPRRRPAAGRRACRRRFWISATVPVRGALVSALGLGFALARMVLERSTTRAVFQ